MAIALTILITSVVWATLYFVMMSYYTKQIELQKQLFLTTHTNNVSSFTKAAQKMDDEYRAILKQSDAKWEEMFLNVVTAGKQRGDA